MEWRNMDKNWKRSWEEFEQWIRNTIGSDFRWCIRPRDDTLENREMVVELILGDIKRNNGDFPKNNVYQMDMT